MWSLRILPPRPTDVPSGGLVCPDGSCPGRRTLRWRAICPGGLLPCPLSCHDRLGPWPAEGSKRTRDEGRLHWKNEHIVHDRFFYKIKEKMGRRA